MRGLVLAGVGALALTLPITFVIVAVLAIVVQAVVRVAGRAGRYRTGDAAVLALGGAKQSRF